MTILSPDAARPAGRAPTGSPLYLERARRRALENWLRRLELRGPLGDRDRAAVLALSGRAEMYGSGRDVVSPGQRVRHACLVADGLLARFGQTAAGTRQLTAFYLAGDMADLPSVVLPRVVAPLQSALHATVLFVPHEELIAAADRSPALARAFWRDCVVDAQVSAEWLLSNGRRDALARVAHLLAELAARYEVAAGLAQGMMREFPLFLTQSHLADAAGLTPVHINRTLRELREAGAVIARERRFEVLDRALLERLGDFDPAYLHLPAAPVAGAA